MRFPHLAAGLSHGPLRIKNRVVFPGHQTLMSSGGVVGDQMYRYCLERAEGEPVPSSSRAPRSIGLNGCRAEGGTAEALSAAITSSPR